MNVKKTQTHIQYNVSHKLLQVIVKHVISYKLHGASGLWFLAMIMLNMYMYFTIK